MTLYPADATLPGSSSLNPVANGGTKANSGVVGLSATGAINLFNHDGPIDALMDITGYYVPGGAGAAGVAGPRGFSAWDPIPSNVTVTGEIVFDGQLGGSSTVSDGISVNLPGIAPLDLDPALVNFGPGLGAADQDLTCLGDVAHPSAPAGKVCIYATIADTGGLTPASLRGDILNLPSRAFQVTWTPSGVAGDDEFLNATWAYTAP